MAEHTARPLVVAVGGVPGSGKTTLARELADTLHVPVLVRDAIKEGLHVTHRSDDPAEVHRFAARAFDLFYASVDLLVHADVSMVIEAAFHRDFAVAEFDSLAKRVDLVAVWCSVPADLARVRYRARAERGERHPAHADLVAADAMDRSDLDWTIYAPPPGSWPLIWVDTTGVRSPTVAVLAAQVLAARSE